MKKWYTSWTIWTNAGVLGVVGILNYLADVAVSGDVTTILLAISNLVLRFKTDTGVTT